MIKKTALGAVAAAAIAVTALAGTASTAQAHHKFGFGFYGGPSIVIGGPGWHGYYGNPCRHWKRKYRRTGRWKYWRRYKRCLRRHW
ncbi:MAG: hypothetical protein AAF441_16860 [Pseudomonadota bacterium]